MTLSMHQASVPVITRMLTNLATFLKKGEADAAARNIDPTVFLTARLAPDMYALTRQVQIVSDIAKLTCRLAGETPPAFEDTETSFAELQDRIARTIAFLDTLTPDRIDGTEAAEVVLRFPQGEMTFPGQMFLFGFILPNVYFHATTAYNILRHNGVALGKMDFLGAP